MLEKRRLKRIFDLPHILLTLLLYSFVFCTSFGIAQQDKDISDNAYKAEVLQKIASLLETKYVFPERAKQYAEEFTKKCERGSYDSYTNHKEFARKITADLINMTKDKHINFRLIESSDIGEKPESSLHHPIRYHRLGIKENKGFAKLEWIEGDIGYLDIRRFYYFSDVRDKIIAAMQILSNAKAIIIDLRENGGGSGEYLSSCFLKHPTQLTSWYSREDDFLEEYWTLKNIGMERLTDVPLFLLTSQRTFSAAESFAYDMKVRERATIVGDATKGGAHSVDLYKIDDQFEIYIPTARAINPITGGNWEGTGVIPDIPVPAESALETAIELAREAGAKFAEAKEEKLKLAVEEMQIRMDRAEKLFRENKQDEAETALDSVFQIAEKHNLINEFFMDVLAYNYFSEKDEQILYAILKKKIEFFPKSPTAYQALGYAYYKNNKKELAITHFENVLKLDPDNRNAKKMIKRLRNE
ncbi:MAG: S41 family peptidase [Candidatus Aminicenantes bacterium]|jgi:tetratricopeptide (TPR) repeat protein